MRPVFLKMLGVLGFLMVLLLLVGVAYWYFYRPESKVAVDLSRSSASVGGVTLTLQPSTTTTAPNQTVTANVMIDTGASTVTAVDLRLAVSGQATIQSLAAGDFLPTVLSQPVTTATTATIVVGSGTTGKQGTGRIATLTLQTGQAGTVAVSVAAGTQASAIGSSGNVLSTLPGQVTITVAAATPPVIQISANPSSIKIGSLVPTQYTSTTLTWSAQNATSTTIDQGVGVVTGASGTRIVAPSTTTTYTITGTGAGGSATKSVTVQVIKIADINGNGAADIFDYNALVGDYGKSGVLASDLDGNQKVDLYDYNILITNYAAQTIQ